VRINNVGVDKIIHKGEEVTGYINDRKIRKNLFLDNADGKNNFIPIKTFPIQPPVSKIINGGTWDALTWSGDINIRDFNEGDVIRISGYYMPYATNIEEVEQNHDGTGLQLYGSNGVVGEGYVGNVLWFVNSQEWNVWFYFDFQITVGSIYKYNLRLEDRGYDYAFPEDAGFTFGYWCNVTIEQI